MILRTFRLSVVIALLAGASLWALTNTNGAPIGGMGTGYINYNARSGNFASSGKTMPPAQRMANEFSNYTSSPSGFHFYVNGTSRPDVTTTTDDAKIPVYTANFGAGTTGVTFTLTAFCPFAPGKEQLSQSPIAYFDIKAVNNTASAINNVAAALEFTNGTLLGGAATGTNDGNNAITWAGATENAYMMVNCIVGSGTGAPSYSAGAMSSFATSGTLTAGSGNAVAAMCSIPANDSAHYRFVISWYQQWTGSKGNEGHWYFNYYTTPASGSKDCSVYGMSNFDVAKRGATGMVNRVMASNFPDWYKDRLMNNLYSLVHNMQCASDGRVGMWEGQYPILGTIDQTEHAALFGTFNWPCNQWRELQFWGRQQWTGSYLGQIHHDFNGCVSGSWDEPAHFFFLWDNTSHSDYWWQPDTRNWGDLQCMFIFKAYELMLATGNRDSLNRHWVKIKNACNRTFNQCVSGAHLCTDATRSSYDDGAGSPTYVSSVSLAAWLAMVEMAKFLGDDSTATRVQNWYTLGRSEFRGRFFVSGWCTGSNYCERDIAGYSWARYLCLPAVMDSDIVVTGCSRLWTYYNGQAGDRNKLGKWHFYTYDHWGGAATAIGQQDTAIRVHQWDYNFYYTASPTYVHWQDLWSNNNVYNSYSTAPCVWRSLFQFTGYLLDNANNRLWIRPMPLRTQNQVITNAPLMNPRGWGTLNFNDSTIGTSPNVRYQNIDISFDSNVTVRQIVLKNDLPTSITPADSNVRIRNNGTAVTGFTVTAEGVSTRGNNFEKILRVTLAAAIQIGTGGANIQVGQWATGVSDQKVRTVPQAVFALYDNRISAGNPVRYSVTSAGHVVLDLLAINGAKIGTIYSGNVSAGSHTAVWSGRTFSGMHIGSGIAVLRLTSRNGNISRVVYIGK